MIILYQIRCRDCGYEVTGETEYFSGKYWFCEKCNSRRLQMNLETGIPHRKEKKDVTNPSRLQEAGEPQAILY